MAEKGKTPGGIEASVTPGPGHNKPHDEVVWDRWQRKRRFVRALEGTYDDLQRRVLDQPRVYRAEDQEFRGGPQLFHKAVINPQKTEIAQSIETEISVIAPDGTGQKHGHMNSAVFYVVKGRGYDIHDGKRLDYEAGDILIVENGCVHQHFNADPKEGLVVLTMKAKPLFLFMHMLFQKTAKLPPKEPVPGFEGWRPPEGS